MGLNWAEHTVEIEAPIQTCFDAITDYETFPSWQSAVVDTEVLDWDEQGRGKRVRLVRRREGPQGRLHARLPL